MKTIKNIILINYLFLFVFISCNDNKIEKAYKIIRIEDKLKNKSCENCFRSSFAFFDIGKKIITLPGFETPLDKGTYVRMSNSILKINNLNDCYFNGKYNMKLSTSNRNNYLIIKNDKISIVCEEVNFKNSTINKSVFKRFLDTLSWNSNYCNDLRNRLCENNKRPNNEK